MDNDRRLLSETQDWSDMGEAADMFLADMNDGLWGALPPEKGQRTTEKKETSSRSVAEVLAEQAQQAQQMQQQQELNASKDEKKPRRKRRDKMQTDSEAFAAHLDRHRRSKDDEKEGSSAKATTTTNPRQTDDMSSSQNSSKKKEEICAKDRNREYARNTRMRKKAYVRDLEETVRSMRGEQTKRRRDEEIDEDSRRSRSEVLRKFLDYRGRGEVNEDAWAEIVDRSNFELRLPVTPYRSYDPAEVSGENSEDEEEEEEDNEEEEEEYSHDRHQHHHREEEKKDGLPKKNGWTSSDDLACLRRPLPTKKQEEKQQMRSNAQTQGMVQHLSGARRICKGLRGLVFDTASFSVMLQSIGVPRRRGHDLVRCEFELLDGGDASHEILFSPTRVLGSWRMRTLNAVGVGALAEAEKKGMLEAWFTKENKLSRIDLCFDVLAFTRELQRCRGGSGADLLELVPNTLAAGLRDLQRDDRLNPPPHEHHHSSYLDEEEEEGVNDSSSNGRRRRRNYSGDIGDLSPAAQRREDLAGPPSKRRRNGEDTFSTEDEESSSSLSMIPTLNRAVTTTKSSSYRQRPRVIALATRPHLITQVNRAFLDLTHFEEQETIGKSLRIIQGPATDSEVVEDFLADVARKIPTSMVVVNYTRSKERFINYLRVYPLFADSKTSSVTHFLAELERLDDDTVSRIEAEHSSQSEDQSDDAILEGETNNDDLSVAQQDIISHDKEKEEAVEAFPLGSNSVFLPSGYNAHPLFGGILPRTTSQAEDELQEEEQQQPPLQTKKEDNRTT